MKNIVYLSTSIKLLNDKQLIEILEIARKNNSERGVTGVLLYSEGTFIQVLEGSDEEVDNTFSKILGDTRHKNLIILIEDDIDKKSFADWSMGFATARADKTEELIGYLKSTDKLQTKGGDSAAITTLKTFIDTNNLSIAY